MNEQPMVRPTHKRCRMCGKTKARKAFGAKDSSGDGLQALCRPCRKQRTRANETSHNGRQVRVAAMVRKLRRHAPPSMPPAVGELTRVQYSLLIYVERLGLMAPDVDALAWRFGAHGWGLLSDETCLEVRAWVQGQV